MDYRWPYMWCSEAIWTQLDAFEVDNVKTYMTLSVGLDILAGLHSMVAMGQDIACENEKRKRDCLHREGRWSVVPDWDGLPSIDLRILYFN